MTSIESTLLLTTVCAVTSCVYPTLGACVMKGNSYTVTSIESTLSIQLSPVTS